MTEQDALLIDEALAAAALVAAAAADDEEAVRVLLADDPSAVALHLAASVWRLYEVLAELDGDDTDTAESLVNAWHQRLLDLVLEEGNQQ